MARSFVYKRPLDAKILSNAEKSNHEFQFNTLLEIKKEVEDEQLDMEIDSSLGLISTNSSDLHDHNHLDVESTSASNQDDKSHNKTHPKLVIKFGDLWRKSKMKRNFSKKIKKRADRDSRNEIPTIRKLRSNKYYTSELKESTKDHISTSSLSTPTLANSARKIETPMNCSQEKVMSDEKEKQDNTNVARIIQSRKNSNKFCESCGMYFDNERKLLAHKRYYNNEGDFHCTICDIRFYRQIQLLRHMKNAHSPSIDENIYKFKCCYCVERFDRKMSWIAHVMHFHNKQVTSNTKMIDSNKDIISHFNSRIMSKKNQKCVRKSKRILKHSPINSNDQLIIPVDNFHSGKDSTDVAGELCNKDEHLMCENFNQTTIDIQDPQDSSHLEHVNTLILDESNERDAATQQIQEEVVGKINYSVTSSKSQLAKTGETEKGNQTQSTIQLDTDIPEDLQLRLEGDSAHHLENTDGNGCVSEPFVRTDKTKHVSRCGSASISVDLADVASKINMTNSAQRTRSSISKSMRSSSFSMKPMTSVIHSDQESTQNEQLPVPEKNICVTEDSPRAAQACLHSDGISGRQEQVLAPNQQLDQQVGSVSFHQGPEKLHNTQTNSNTVNTAIECNKSDINLIQVNGFEEDYKLTFLNYDDDEMTDGSCESISLKIPRSPSNVSLENESTLEFDDVNVPTSCDTLDDTKIKDARVVLVKLESMTNRSTLNSSPKTSVLEDCSLAKSEKLSCNLCDKPFITRIALRQHCKRQHQSVKVKLNSESREIRNKRIAHKNALKVLSNNIKSRKLNDKNLMQGTPLNKNCYLCDEVFQNISLLTTHYFSVHIQDGVLQCCLCNSSFRTSRKLRFHLFRHYTGYSNQGLAKFCVTCKKNFSTPSLRSRCLDCQQNSKKKRCKSRKGWFLDTRNQRSAYQKVNDNSYVSKNISIPLVDTPSIPMIKKRRANRKITVTDLVSTKHDKTVVRISRPKIRKHFKCPVCDRVFLKIRRLNLHLFKAHSNVRYCKCRKCQKVVKTRPLTHLTSRNSKHKPRKCRENQNHSVKLGVGKRRNLKSRHIDAHAKLCKKKLCARQKLRVLPVNNTNQHFIRRHYIPVDVKKHYDRKCDICGLNCCCRQGLKIHKRRYLANGKNVCNICGITFAWKHLLVAHMKAAHNPKILFYGKVKCEICNQRFYNKKFLRIHLAHFHNIKYYQCRICRIRFDTRRSLNTHRMTYSNNLNSLCRICNESFRCKYMLEYHEAQVHNRTKLKLYKCFCDECNFGFLDELLLQAHIGHFHYMQDRETETDTNNIDKSKATEQLPENIELPPKPEDACSDLNDTTNNSIILEDANQVCHAEEITENAVGNAIRTHTSTEYKCGICKLSFHDPYGILNHEWEFSNDGIYACHVCNRKFMTTTLLKNHKIKHYQRNVIRKYKCYVCKEDFSDIEQLKMHGLHLHGPQFTWEKNTETADINNPNTVELQINRDCDGDLIKGSYDTIGLIASNEVFEGGTIQFFQKLTSNESSTGLLRRYSNEDAYCCNFCETNFTSASLLEDHIKKHTYRAYYTNSSRYLCLICKNKFRTNDILRAHVIHCHTSDEKEPIINKPECSKDSLSKKLVNFQAPNYTDQTDTKTAENMKKNVTENSSSEGLNSKLVLQDQLTNSRKCTIKTLETIPPIIRTRLSNHASEVGMCQSEHGPRTSVIHEVKRAAKNRREYVDLEAGDNVSSNDLKLVGSVHAKRMSHIEFDSTPQELNLFSLKLNDVEGVQQLACTICTVTFNSVEQFREHFVSIHMENGIFLCIFCGEQFSVMSDLKFHTLEHDGEQKQYTCCNQEFLLMTDFIRHKLSHNKQTRNAIIETQLSPLLERDFPNESDENSNDDKTTKLCKCEFCDKRFPDFDTLLKHWNSCSYTNGSQCELCGTVFKSLHAFRAHKMTHHLSRQPCNTIEKRRSPRVNAGQIIPTSMPSNITHDNNRRSNTAIASLCNKNTTESLGLGGMPVKSYAEVLKTTKNNNKRRINKHQQNEANGTTEPRLRFDLTQNVQSLKRPRVQQTTHEHIAIENVRNRMSVDMKGNTSSTASTIHLPGKSLAKVHQLDSQVPNSISSNGNGRNSSYHIPIQDSNYISNKQIVANDFRLRFQQNELGKHKLSTMSPISSLDTANIPETSKSTVQSTINIGNKRIVSNGSGSRFRSNDRKEKRLPNILPALSNAADKSPYYLRFQNALGHSYTKNNQTVAACNSVKKLHSNSVSSPLNPSMGSISSLSANSDNSFNRTTTTLALNDSRLNTHSNEYTTSRLRMLLPKSSSGVSTSTHTSDIIRITNSPKSNTAQKPVSPTVNTSTNIEPSTLRKRTPKVGNTSRNKKNPSKEYIQRQQVVRCSYCNLLFTEKSKFIKHMEIHKAENQCPACGLIFSNERALEQHLPEHKCSTCPQCKMMHFFSDSNASLNGTPNLCSSCHILLPVPTYRLSHSRENSEAGPLMKCGICMDMFGTISQMTVHFKMVHLSLICGTCDSRFSTKTSLQNHMRTHGNDSLEICRTCNKYYSSKSELAIHALSHLATQTME